MNIKYLLQGYGLEKMATINELKKTAVKKPKKVMSQDEADMQDEMDLALEAEPSPNYSSILPYLLGAGALGLGGYGAYKNWDKIRNLFGISPKQKHLAEQA